MSFNQIAVIIFKVQTFLSFASERLSVWLLSPFDTILVVLNSFLTIWYNKEFQTHFVHFVPQTTISHFFKKP